MSAEKGLKYGFFALAGIAVILGVVLLGKKKPDDDGGGGDEVEPVKPNQPVIDPRQAAVPLDLKAILASKDPMSLLKGRKLYAKINKAKGRNEARVNDGWGLGSNVIFESTPEGEFLGYAQFVSNDRNSAKDANGKIYKWIRITLDDKAWNRYNDTKSFLTRQLVKNKNNDWAYFREDVIRF
jgi:hypothetical protein